MSLVYTSVSMVLLRLAAPPSSIFIGPLEAEVLMAAGATVIDARGDKAEAPYLPNARVIDWKTMREGWGRTGELGDPDDARKKLARLGVVRDRRVILYGAMGDGWGEEGRLWWTLRYLGHPSVHILDGGIALWRREGRRTSSSLLQPLWGAKDDLGDAVRPELRADIAVVKNAQKKSRRTHILDVRSAAEWKGATPYGEARGGHIPGAKHLEWSLLIGSGQTILPKETVAARLRAIGVRARDPIIVYCTGGVRSAFVQAVLLHSGFRNVANYDGSWFEWAAQVD